MTGRRIRRVLETAVYVDDLERALAFYGGVLGIEAMFRSDRAIALDAGQGSVLLLFLRGRAKEGVTSGTGDWIPPHDGSGPSHFALAVDADELEAWRDRLQEAGVEVESEIRWSRGGTSLYIRDPDGHSVELATPGVWPTY